MTPAGAADRPLPTKVPKSVLGSLNRFRLSAYVDGAGLIILVFIGVPLQIWAGTLLLVAIVGPLHGVFYIVYLLRTLHLARQLQMAPSVMIPVMLAGLIPFMSFVAERRVTALVLAPSTAAKQRNDDTNS